MRPEFIVIMVVCIVAAAFIYRWWQKRRAAKKSSAMRMQEIIDSLVVQTITPHNVFVLSRNPLSEERQAAIDAAFDRMVTNASRIGYTNFLDPANYTIMVFPSVRDYNAEGVYCPSFQVFIEPGSSYDDSQYDQEPDKEGGWIYAAEQVVDLDRGIFIIADAEQAGYTTDSVYNGLDHIVLWHNDRPRYDATWDHSQGGGHPIIT